MKDLCTNCVDRDICEELCDRANDYAEQDHIDKHWRISYVENLDRLDWLANHVSTLSLAEMQNEVELNLEDWKFVEEDCEFPLTEQQSQCLYLYFWMKWTQKKIGKELGITRQAVTKHIKYAKKKLIKMLKSE